MDHGRDESRSPWLVGLPNPLPPGRLASDRGSIGLVKIGSRVQGYRRRILRRSRGHRGLAGQESPMPAANARASSRHRDQHARRGRPQLMHKLGVADLLIERVRQQVPVSSRRFRSINTTQLTQRPAPILPTPAGDYGPAVIIGENTFAARVVAHLDDTRLSSRSRSLAKAFYQEAHRRRARTA